MYFWPSRFGNQRPKFGAYKKVQFGALFSVLRPITKNKKTDGQLCLFSIAYVLSELGRFAGAGDVCFDLVPEGGAAVCVTVGRSEN